MFMQNTKLEKTKANYKARQIAQESVCGSYFGTRQNLWGETPCSRAPLSRTHTEAGGRGDPRRCVISARAGAGRAAPLSSRCWDRAVVLHRQRREQCGASSCRVITRSASPLSARCSHTSPPADFCASRRRTVGHGRRHASSTTLRPRAHCALLK
jgi:hypothetical protein